MEVIIQPDAARAAAYAARIFSKLIRAKPAAVLGLATGGTPLALYDELVRMHREEHLDFAGVTTFNLDEYLGLEPSHLSSYRHFMMQHLFRHLNIPEARTHVPDACAQDVEQSCQAYEAAIAGAGGIDLQLLGIGTDGHIGFNEPGSSLASRTRIKTLTPRTREDNAPYFPSPDAVPHHAITMGVGTIMEARQIVLLAFGRHKARALANAIEGPVTAMVPASVLQMHPDVVILADEDASSLLEQGEYYRWVFAHKPAWQRV